MSQLLAIKERIRTITNLRKVTRAMELVTRTRINRSRANATSARRYQQMFEGLYTLASRNAEEAAARLTNGPKTPRRIVVGFLSQKGFCGGFNDRVLSTLSALLRKLEGRDSAETSPGSPNPELVLVGRRNSKWAYALKREFRHIAAPERSHRQELQLLAHELAELAGCGLSSTSSRTASGSAEIYLVFNELISIMEQRPMVLRVIPAAERDDAADDRSMPEFEPDAEELLPVLVPAYVEACLYRAYWETIAGENSARLLSMKNANDNATKMLDSLHLEYNKTRQTKITQELSEIVSAFDVLKLSQQHLHGEE